MLCDLATRRATLLENLEGTREAIPYCLMRLPGSTPPADNVWYAFEKTLPRPDVRGAGELPAPWVVGKTETGEWFMLCLRPEGEFDAPPARLMAYKVKTAHGAMAALFRNARLLRDSYVQWDVDPALTVYDEVGENTDPQAHHSYHCIWFAGELPDLNDSANMDAALGFLYNDD